MSKKYTIEIVETNNDVEIHVTRNGLNIQDFILCAIAIVEDLDEYLLDNNMPYTALEIINARKDKTF